jgi:hypothetical protein
VVSISTCPRSRVVGDTCSRPEPAAVTVQHARRGSVVCLPRQRILVCVTEDLPRRARACVAKDRGDKWLFPFLSLSNFEDNPFSIIE